MSEHLSHYDVRQCVADCLVVLAATIPPLPTTYPALAETLHRMSSRRLRLDYEDEHFYIWLGGAQTEDGRLGLEVGLCWWAEIVEQEETPCDGQLNVGLFPGSWDAPTVETFSPGRWCDTLSVMAARAAAILSPPGRAPEETL